MPTKESCICGVESASPGERFLCAAGNTIWREGLSKPFNWDDSIRGIQVLVTELQYLVSLPNDFVFAFVQSVFGIFQFFPSGKILQLSLSLPPSLHLSIYYLSIHPFIFFIYLYISIPFSCRRNGYCMLILCHCFLIGICTYICTFHIYIYNCVIRYIRFPDANV